MSISAQRLDFDRNLFFSATKFAALFGELVRADLVQQPQIQQFILLSLKFSNLLVQVGNALTCLSLFALSATPQNIHDPSARVACWD